MKIFLVHTTWCQPCIEMVPRFKKFMMNQGIETHVVDATNHLPPDNLKRHVQRVPTLLITNDEGEVKATKVGNITNDEIMQFILSSKQILNSEVV